MKNEQPVHILGLMSGSSLDGLDMALCEFQGNRSNLTWDLVDFNSAPYTKQIQSMLSQAPRLSALDLARLDAQLTSHVAAHILEFRKKQDRPIDFIASHGHTVFHEPEREMTLQIIQGGYLSSKTGLSVISDFRTQDLALGGQGAPIVPISERDLFYGYDFYLNLGGIANLTIADPSDFRAFDVCPCNQVLNYFSRQNGKEFDDGGHIAATGSLDSNLLDALNGIEYYAKAQPKSLDNSWVRDEFMQVFEFSKVKIEDKLHTMVVHIAEQIVHAIEKNRSEGIEASTERCIYITGGGAFNTFLVENLKKKLAKINIATHIPDPRIIQAKESILMAYMGYLRLQNEPNVLKSVTGSSSNSCSGAIYITG